jgi:predicted dehydrogenase
MTKKSKTYGLPEDQTKKPIPAPELPYQPPKLKKYNPPIGLIACGGITQSHLRAYKAAGYNVVALCDLIKERAENRRKEFYPDAKVYTDYKELLRKHDEIEVVDIATHPPERVPLIADSIKAGRHVLSQKPFVINIDTGLKLIDLADKHNVTLAVNQNGRWAPHFAWYNQAVRRGLIGDVLGVHMSVHWDHNWIADHAVFNTVYHIILYDFAIHWFDRVNCLLPNTKATRVYASLSPAAGQRAKPPLLGQAIIEFEGAQASLQFDGATPFGSWNRDYLAGNKGSILVEGPDMTKLDVTLSTKNGIAKPKLEGQWFSSGFHGTMAELLSSIEQKRVPYNHARSVIRSLELCFAAVRSAETGKPQIPGKVRTFSK